MKLTKSECEAVFWDHSYRLFNINNLHLLCEQSKDKINEISQHLLRLQIVIHRYKKLIKQEKNKK